MMQGRTAGTWSPVAKALPMSKPIIRYLRFHCPTPTSMPQANRDGALAVATIRENVARLRELSPLWEMYQDGIDISTIQWTAH